MRKTDISRGIDAPIGRLQIIIHPNALNGVAFDLRHFQLQPFDIGDPAHASQYVVDGDRALSIVTDEIDEFLSRYRRSDRSHGGVQMDLDAVARQRFGEYLGGIAFFLGQEFRVVLYDDHVRS